MDDSSIAADGEQEEQSAVASVDDSLFKSDVEQEVQGEVAWVDKLARQERQQQPADSVEDAAEQQLLQQHLPAANEGKLAAVGNPAAQLFVGDSDIQDGMLDGGVGAGLQQQQPEVFNHSDESRLQHQLQPLPLPQPPSLPASAEAEVSDQQEQRREFSDKSGGAPPPEAVETDHFEPAVTHLMPEHLNIVPQAAILVGSSLCPGLQIRLGSSSELRCRVYSCILVASGIDCGRPGRGSTRRD